MEWEFESPRPHHSSTVRVAMDLLEARHNVFDWIMGLPPGVWVGLIMFCVLFTLWMVALKVLNWGSTKWAAHKEAKKKKGGKMPGIIGKLMMKLALHKYMVRMRWMGSARDKIVNEIVGDKITHILEEAWLNDELSRTEVNTVYRKVGMALRNRDFFPRNSEERLKALILERITKEHHSDLETLRKKFSKPGGKKDTPKMGATILKLVKTA